MQLKKDLQAANTFKCRKFKLANGALCDVLNMVENPANSGSYQNDCLKADGTVEAKEYSCTLAEFTTLTRDFNTRLDKVFRRLDGAAAVTQSKINVNMRNLVNRNVIAKIQRVADGLTCGLLGTFYQEFIDGTCYAGVWGFTQISKAYVATGALTLVLVIIMYVVWRISIDNYNVNSKVTALQDRTDP